MVVCLNQTLVILSALTRIFGGVSEIQTIKDFEISWYRSNSGIEQINYDLLKLPSKSSFIT